MKENRKLLREVLKDIRHDMTDEEVLNLLADSKISENLAGENEKYTLGQRAADAIAKFAGSWAFIFAFTGVLTLWMLVNTLLGFALLGLLHVTGLLARLALGLNLFNALVIAVLGVPGLALLVLLRMIFI